MTEERKRWDVGEETNDLWSLVDYLNIYSYDEQSQCFALADGSIGTLIEFAPIACTCADFDDRTEISQALALALSSLREEITGQVILVPSIDITEELKQYQRAGGTDQIGRAHV
mgnify:FL=1